MTEKARANRETPTPAERKIWLEVLRSKRFQGLKFRRQKPLDEYIVDFYCIAYMLAIEIDGDSHGEQEEYDQKRTERLSALGVTVVRFTNTEVMANIQGVYEELMKTIIELEKPPQAGTNKANPPSVPPYEGREANISKIFKKLT